jgi:guanine deaminase
MPLKRYDNMGLSIGLGSDVAGGYSLSMLNEMRESIESSKTLSYFLQESNYESVITPSEAFYFATLGGATVLGMENKIGSLEVGKKADFIIVDYQSLNETTEQYHQAEQILSQLIYRGDRGTIREVYVGGERV